MLRRFAYFLVLFLCLESVPAISEEIEFITFEHTCSYVDKETNQAKGLIVELIKTVTEASGHEAKFNFAPWARAYMEVKKVLFDAALHPFKTPERQKHLDYSNEVILWEHVVFYRRKGTHFEFNGNLSELEARIGVVRGYSYGSMFDQAKQNMQLDIAPTEQANIKKLIHDRFDLMIGYLYTTKAFLKEEGLEDLVERLPIVVESVPSFIAFSKKKNKTNIRDEFDKQLRIIKSSGLYNEILTKHGFEIFAIPQETKKLHGVE